MNSSPEGEAESVIVCGEMWCKFEVKFLLKTQKRHLYFLAINGAIRISTRMTVIVNLARHSHYKQIMP